METCTHTEHNYTCVVVYSHPKSTLMANQCPFCAAEVRIKELAEEKADLQDELKSCEADLKEANEALVNHRHEITLLQMELKELVKESTYEPAEIS